MNNREKGLQPPPSATNQNELVDLHGLCAKLLPLCSTLCDPIVAHQALLSMGFSRQEYWSELSCPPPGDLPDPVIEPESLMSSALADRFFTTSTVKKEVKVKVTQSCLTLCDPMDYTVHGISPGQNTGVGNLSLLQRSSQPRDQTQVSRIAGGFFTSRATGKPMLICTPMSKPHNKTWELPRDQPLFWALLSLPEVQPPGQPEWTRMCSLRKPAPDVIQTSQPAHYFSVPLHRCCLGAMKCFFQITRASKEICPNALISCIFFFLKGKKRNSICHPK